MLPGRCLFHPVTFGLLESIFLINEVMFCCADAVPSRDKSTVTRFTHLAKKDQSASHGNDGASKNQASRLAGERDTRGRNHFRLHNHIICAL